VPEVKTNKASDSELKDRIRMEYEPEEDPKGQGEVISKFSGFVYNPDTKTELDRREVIKEIDILNVSTKVRGFLIIFLDADIWQFDEH
jgi:hypothetical protein